MKTDLETIGRQVDEQNNLPSPPLHLWHPPLSGDIDIRIDADGSWHHEGAPIRRDRLVRLFASILRREEDGDYYLVTPVEKWRIQVVLHPLLVTDVDPVGEPDDHLLATLNTGRSVRIGEDAPLFLEPTLGDIAAISLPNGLSALFSRAAWYRLVDLAEVDDGRSVVHSGKYQFELAAAG